MGKKKLPQEVLTGILIFIILLFPIIVLRLNNLITEKFYFMLLSFIFIYFISTIMSAKFLKEIERDNFNFLFWSPIFSGFLGSYFFIALSDPDKLPSFYITLVFAGFYALIIFLKVKIMEKK
jgi:hypothetical protein